MTEPRSQLLYSRSARDLSRLAREHPEALAESIPERPLLAEVSRGRHALEEALDRERRELIRADEERLSRYQAAARQWTAAWPRVAQEIADLPLPDAHRIVTSRAEGTLPFAPPGRAR